MSQEIDDFLFSSSGQSAPAAVSTRSAYQPQASLPTQKPERAKVEMPAAEEIVAPVAEAAKKAKLEAPAPKPESVIHQLTDEISNNWKPILFTAGTIAAAEAGRRYLKNRSVVKAPGAEVPQTAERIEPTFAQETPVQTENRLQQLKDRIIAGQQAGLGPKQPPTFAQGPQATYGVPTANVPPTSVQSPVAPTPAAGQVQPPTAPAQPAVPSAAEAVATGQSPAKAVQMDVAKQLDAAEGVPSRVRRTNAQIEQQLQEAFAKAPPGMRPAAPSKTNKLPGDVIGQGGWHWYQGQMGPEAEQAWLQQFGRTNQSYRDVQQAVKEGRLPVPAPVEGKKGGAHPRQEYVPEYIKGNISLAQLGSLAANALGAAGLLQAYKQGKETGDWSNLGLGAAEQVLSNVAPKAGLAMSLMAPGTTNAGEQEELAKRRKKKATID